MRLIKKIKFEMVIALVMIILLFPFMFFTAVLIKIESKGPFLFWSKRYGISKNLFYMPKFRSMSINTPIVTTRRLINPDVYITRVGKIIRKTSIDELPQLWSIFIGDMSFIGPRPLLWTEKRLLSQREKFKGNSIKPGITGWAQVNGRDMNSPQKKIEHEKFYIKNKSIILNIKIIAKTLIILLSFKNIAH